MMGLVAALGVTASLAAFFLLQHNKLNQPVVIQVRPVQSASGSSAPGVAVPQTPAEVYSNGLRVDTRFAVQNHPRSYLAFPMDRPAQTEGVQRSVPAGIVFHTTESRQAPFEPDQNRVLKKLGESLLEYVRRERAYHFLIDRFGRVYRIVAETDAANHSG